MERGMKWGYCIPSTCSRQDLTDSLTDYIKPKDDLFIRVFETDCHYGGDMPYSVLDWFTMWVHTIYDMHKTNIRVIYVIVIYVARGESEVLPMNWDIYSCNVQYFIPYYDEFFYFIFI